jgi:hypothetical protein
MRLGLDARFEKRPHALNAASILGIVGKFCEFHLLVGMARPGHLSA